MIDQLERQFSTAIEENKERIYRICKSYAVAPIEPQDMFQEVLLQIWKSLPSFKGNSKISTWIYRIAINVCYTSKLKLDKKNEKTSRFESIHFIPEENSDPVMEEKFQALQGCINSLNVSDKSIMVLYLEELPYKEIAQIIGLTENNVAVKMKRIREKLFACITAKLN